MNKIGFGTWTIGENFENRAKEIEIIKYVIKCGIYHIDTAPSYANGRCEEIVGEAISHFPREKLFIATKVGRDDLTYERLINSCRISLKRLKTDYVDLLYIHYPNPNVSLDETTKALNFLLSSGLVKNVGLSNSSVDTIKQYSKLLIKPIYAVQNQYNLICRESQVKGVINYCQNNNIKFVAYRPIRYAYPGAKDPYYNKNTYPILDEIAKKYGKSNIQIATKWLLKQDNVSIVFKSLNQQHINEILETNSFDITCEDFEYLNNDFPIKKTQSCNSAGYYEIV